MTLRGALTDDDLGMLELVADRTIFPGFSVSKTQHLVNLGIPAADGRTIPQRLRRWRFRICVGTTLDAEPSEEPAGPFWIDPRLFAIAAYRLATLCVDETHLAAKLCPEFAFPWSGAFPTGQDVHQLLNAESRKAFETATDEYWASQHHVCVMATRPADRQFFGKAKNASVVIGDVEVVTYGGDEPGLQGYLQIRHAKTKRAIDVSFYLLVEICKLVLMDQDGIAHLDFLARRPDSDFDGVDLADASPLWMLPPAHSRPLEDSDAGADADAVDIEEPAAGTDSGSGGQGGDRNPAPQVRAADPDVPTTSIDQSPMGVLSMILTLLSTDTAGEGLAAELAAHDLSSVPSLRGQLEAAIGILRGCADTLMGLGVREARLADAAELEAARAAIQAQEEALQLRTQQGDARDREIQAREEAFARSRQELMTRARTLLTQLSGIDELRAALQEFSAD